MKPIGELDLGYFDAELYKQRAEKEHFNQIFVRTEALDQIAKGNVFFVVGEKGTGKTAHALYFTNNSYLNFSSRITYIRETDYEKFVYLKTNNQLALSNYSNTWKVILYLLMSQKLLQDDNKDSILKFFRFRSLQDAIDEYYSYEFSPEIQYAMNFVEEHKLAAELLSKYAKAGGDTSKEISFTETRFQTNLLYIERQFENALRSIKLTKSHILFIDGIDIRPHGLEYEDYLECVRGLANAVWTINSDFFANIKDSKGRMKVVLLMRPDIFDSLGLQNRNNKLRDNSVLLNWLTTYAQYRTSHLFKMADKLLSSQQTDEMLPGEAWDTYFPYKEINRSRSKREPTDSSFIEFLRLSMYRPRDILAMLRILQDQFRTKYEASNEPFSYDDVHSPEFLRDYSNYLIGEVKDQLSFYYTNDDYQIFLEYFTYIKWQPKISYEDYLAAYDELMVSLSKRSKTPPSFLDTADTFLQFIYELNVIAYEERVGDNEIFIRWCFRERNPSNVSPKVKTHVEYRIHDGLFKALNIGRKYK